MDWWWWIKNIFHLETLFFVFVVIFFIYCLMGGSKRGSLLKKLKHISYRKKPKRVNKNEERCRVVFETHFAKSFPTIRPWWLKNPETGKKLELDGFNPTIRTPLGVGLAFEYDGAQHAQYTPAFHKSKDDFIKQMRRDNYKDRRCKEMGVMLIRIPHTIDKHDIRPYIEKKLKTLGL